MQDYVSRLKMQVQSDSHQCKYVSDSSDHSISQEKFRQMVHHGRAKIEV